MIQPEIKPRKKPRPAYRKSAAIRELERMANEAARQRYPAADRHGAIASRTFRDDTANSLTDCIVKYITLKGGFASRINSAGVYRPNLGKYTRSTQKRGIADILATYRGLSLHIEAKHGRDVLSASQKKVEAEVNRSGGKYVVAKNFTDFKNWFDDL